MGSDSPSWVRDAVVYQIFPDRFASSTRVHKPGPLEAWDSPPTRYGFKGGDLLGIAEHLDHIADLGADTISLNPIFASAANHRYHTYDYAAVDPLLGGDAALRELLDAAHARGMRVVLDGVFNHASRGFWPFHHVMENGGASPYVDWFILNREWLAAGRQLLAYGEPEMAGDLEEDWAEAHAGGIESLRTLGYRAWWDLPALPKLNTDNPEVREYLMGIAERWTRFGADGWRLDVADEIESAGFWEEFRARVRAVNPDAYILAEVWEERPELLDGRTYDALMNYPFLCATVAYAAGAQLDRRVASQHAWLARRIVPLDGPAFARAIAHLAELYPPDARDVMLNLVGSHDTPRFRSMAGGDAAAMRLALLVQMTFPGAPSIYYGDEVGLGGEMDPASRGPFPWDPRAWDAALLDHARALVALRRATPSLRAGELRVLGASGGAVAYLRRARQPDADPAVVALNNAEVATTLHVADPALAGCSLRAAPLPGGSATELTADAEGRIEIPLAARSGVVLLPRP